MHFDDRLATVLRQPASAEGLARVQFRQLVDILGHTPETAEPGEAIEAGFARLEALARRIPPAERARLLGGSLQPMSNPRLLAWLAQAEPDVACAAIGAAKLDDAAWLALIPRLPVRARGILRHRRDLSPPVEALLHQLGVHDRALPAADDYGPEPDPESPIPDVPATPFKAPTGDIAADQDISADVLDLLDMADNPPPPTSLSEWAKARAAQHAAQQKDQHPRPASPAAAASDVGIGAIVRRIEEFRKAREDLRVSASGRLPDAAPDSPRLPLGDTLPTTPRIARAIDFATDEQGRIAWADGPWASSVVGLALAVQSGEIASAVRRRQPLRAAAIAIPGAPAVAGAWQVDAVARFEHGRFTGYCGRLRRPAQAPAAPQPAVPDTTEADRMREVLHELRTPANAIQVAAEIIQQQLYGPAPHEYRALAAAIAGDCAHILAGFEELDRLAKLESGAPVLDEGDSDLARVLAQTVLRLRAWTEPRGSGFALAGDPSATSLPVRVARAEVERLVWRLFAALAGSTAPGESLALSWRARTGMVDLTVALPSLLAEREPAALFDAVPGERGQSLATGMFGVGFTLRLAAAEAAAAGGLLQRVENTLVLSLPDLTDTDAGHSTSLNRSR
jgi:signal transduction histidine kinase